MKKLNGKRLLSMASALLMAAAMFGGCGETPAAESSSNSAGTASASSTEPASSAPEDADSLTKYKEPITLTWMSTDTADYPLEGAGLKATFDKISEATNVTVKWVPVLQSDYTTIYATTMASGQKNWPNLMTGALSTLNTDGPLGAFVALDTLLPEKIPNAKAAIDGYNRWDMVVCLTDGSIYGIPRTGQSQNSFSWLLREDWLQKCGLQEPKTLDEYANVLREFKKQNPGNAPADMNWPFAARNGVHVWIPNTFGSFGMNSVYWTPDADGKAVLNMKMPQYKDCLQWWHQLYAEGLIDPEVITGDGARWQSSVNNSYSGATIDYSVRATQFTNDIRNPSEDAQAAGVKPLADAKMIGITPLSGPNAADAKISCYDPMNTAISVGIMSSSTPEQIEAACCLLNYIYSEEGSQLLSWGEDGGAYSGLDANGNPQWKPELLEKYSIALTAELGIQPTIARPLTLPEVNQFTYPGLGGEAKAKNEGHYEERHPVGYLDPADQARLDTLQTDVGNLYMTSMAQFLSGERSFDDWDAFLAEVDVATSGSEYIDLINKSLDNAKGRVAELGL